MRIIPRPNKMNIIYFYCLQFGFMNSNNPFTLQGRFLSYYGCLWTFHVMMKWCELQERFRSGPLEASRPWESAFPKTTTLSFHKEVNMLAFLSPFYIRNLKLISPAKQRTCQATQKPVYKFILGRKKDSRR